MEVPGSAAFAVGAGTRVPDSFVGHGCGLVIVGLVVGGGLNGGGAIVGYGCWWLECLGSRR